MRMSKIQENTSEVLSFLEIDGLAGHQRNNEARQNINSRAEYIAMVWMLCSNPLDAIPSLKTDGFDFKKFLYILTKALTKKRSNFFSTPRQEEFDPLNSKRSSRRRG
ncbi:hypothetical protein Tco_0829463 [Tanacetum coccineum]